MLTRTVSIARHRLVQIVETTALLLLLHRLDYRSRPPGSELEGLLYNVPVEKFKDSYQDCFVNAIHWIQDEADKEKLLCANEQYYLLRDNSLVCWKPADAEAFLKAAITLWNSWP